MTGSLILFEAFYFCISCQNPRPSPSQEEAVCLKSTVFSTHNCFSVSISMCSSLWNNIIDIARSLWSVSVGSLSLLLDFLPKVHGEGGHGVGGQDDDGAAHKVWGAASPGCKPPALPVQVRVCRLHGVRQGLHASSCEGTLHFLQCCGVFPFLLTTGFFICLALLDEDVKSFWLRRVPGDTRSSVMSGDWQAPTRVSWQRDKLWGWRLIIIEQMPVGNSLCF